MTYNTNNKKVAVLLWLYHKDLAEEFRSLLYDYSDLVDIHLSLCEDNDNAEILNVLNSLNNIKSISYYPNCGADMYSFLQELPRINNKYFVKIHSKKSLWGTNKQCNWRCMLLDNIFSDVKTFSQNIEMMDKYDVHYLCPSSISYRGNDAYHTKQIDQLLKILDTSNNSNRFSGGNMFIGQTNFYQTLFTEDRLNTVLDLICSEKGKVLEKITGTYCHGLERVLGYVVNKEKFRYSFFPHIKIRAHDPKLLSKGIKFLKFRQLHCGDIYCCQQPNIYGTIIKSDENVIKVVWKHTKQLVQAEYVRLYKNTYTKSNIVY